MMLGLGFIVGMHAAEMIVPAGATIAAGDSAVFASSGSAELFAFNSGVTVITFISAVVTLLLVWTVILLLRSLKNQKSIEQTNKALGLEIRKSEKAADDLREIHRKLSAASGQLGGLLEGTTDLIAAVDANYDLISFNVSYKKAIAELFGAEIEVGSNVIEFQADYPEMMERSKELWSRALSGEKFTDEQVFLKTNGEPRHYELSYNPIKSDGGEIIGACQLTRDVTERIRTAEKLKQERDFVSAAFDVSSALVFVLDREGRIIRFNRASELVSGFTADEVNGRVFWNVLLPAEEINQVKSNFRKIGEDKVSKTEWLSHWVTKDENLKLISYRTSCIRDESGAIEYIVATGIDLTEKNELETARNRMLAILENSDDFISISDLHGNVVYMNRAGRQLLGLSPDAPTTQLRLQSCHPEWAREVIQAEGIPKAVKYGSWLGNTALRTVDNDEIPTSHMILSHKGPDGRVEYISTVARNRTSEKQLEEELAEARDAAIKTTNLKSEFLANMSHEIRTPMNGIVGITELLAGTELNEEQADYVKSITTSGEALLAIINDILDFSKIEAGKLEFENKPFDLSETVESVMDLFAHQAFQKDIEISMLIRSDVPRKINGDSGRIRQILTNLVGNAVKFTDKGDVAVRITCEGDQLKFAVRDTGIGISEEGQEVLFTAFGQAETTVIGSLGGTGLGLAISKQLVTMMGGTIGFQSEAGNGSEFYFQIPFEASGRKGDSIYADLRGMGPERVLIVDDDDGIRGLLVYQIKAMSLEAEEAATTTSALEMLGAAADLKEPFDAVIIDAEMPGNGGILFAEEITKNPRFRSIKVVLLLRADDRTNHRAARHRGIDRFILKPIKTSSIMKALTRKSGKHPDVAFDDNQPAAAESSKSNGSSAPIMNDKMKILIAEDNLVNQKVILNQVTKLGYKADLVENGQQALDALDQNRYSLILMDCQMPVMDGFEATTKIRELEIETGKRIPIIAVTAHAIAGDRERCIEHGMDDYISKPTDQQTLRDVIGQWAEEIPDEGMSGESGDSESDEDALPGENSEEQSIRARLEELGEECGYELVLECIELFIKDSADALERLEGAYGDRDGEQINREAHKLKGSSANMGATRLPKICQTLMALADEEEFDKIEILIKQIRGEHRFLVPVYTRIKDEASTGDRELQPA